MSMADREPAGTEPSPDPSTDLEAAPASELGSPLSWVMVGAGMALVAGLWSAILL